MTQPLDQMVHTKTDIAKASGIALGVGVAVGLIAGLVIAVRAGRTQVQA